MSGFAPHALFNHGAGFAEQLFLNVHDIAVIRDRRTGTGLQRNFPANAQDARGGKAALAKI
ncbi:hypothetical protein V3O24_02130 [Methylobacter sp. Wu8]|jgi:hypothetical protein